MGEGRKGERKKERKTILAVHHVKVFQWRRIVAGLLVEVQCGSSATLDDGQLRLPVRVAGQELCKWSALLELQGSRGEN